MDFRQAVEAFIDANDFGPMDMPMVTALRKAAEELDTNGVQSALLNTFGVTYRTLLKEREEAAADPLEALLSGK